MSTLAAELKFKDGDGPRFAFHAETTDRLLVCGSNGRIYTLLGANLPGGRGMGEPVRLMVDLPNEARDRRRCWSIAPGEKLLVASSAGDGFVVPEDEVLAQTRAGKAGAERARGREGAGLPAGGRAITSPWSARTARCWSSRLPSCPRWRRGKGVRLQKYKDGGLSDATTFELAEGLSWKDPAGRTRTADRARRMAAARAPGPAAWRRAASPRDNRFT